MATSAFLMACSVWAWRDWSTSSLYALLQSAVGDHRDCALAHSLPERPMSLAEAAQRYGGIYARLDTVEPADRAPAGRTQKILARHACVIDGHRFAHIVLSYKGQVVSLLVADDARPGSVLFADRSEPVALSTLPPTNGFHIASFHDASHQVFVVSSLPDDDVKSVARAWVVPVSRVLAGQS